MFKQYRDICDVVSLLAYCPGEHSYLLVREASGEFWLPSTRAEKNCWKMTAHKINYDLFGTDCPAAPVQPLRVYKVWLPHHQLPAVYHAVYKVAIKTEVKKKRIKSLRARLQWVNSVELDRQRAHAILKSPEVALFAEMAIGEMLKDADNVVDLDAGLLVETSEDSVLIPAETGTGSAGSVSPNFQLLLAAHYNKEDQIRIYREFILMVFPAQYMSPMVFTQFMLDLGWPRAQCPGLFRAADVTGRGGLSFLELTLWSAALEPATQHSGLPAEIRCRYIFRYFDTNRDSKLEYVEFKELVAAARAARQLPVDALSVARDADVCLRQLGLQPNSQVPLADFLRGIGELRLRGTSSLLRSPKSVVGYLMDLQESDYKQQQSETTDVITKNNAPSVAVAGDARSSLETAPGGGGGRRVLQRLDYNVATYTVRLHRDLANELLELKNFDEDAVSQSTARLLTGAGAGPVTSLDVLGPSSAPVQAMKAVHYFAYPIDKMPLKRTSVNPLGTPSPASQGKVAFAWSAPAEEAALGALLLKLAEAVKVLCTKEPRLLRISSPVYAVGDLHGNLHALLDMESALWPSGAALTPARLLFLGDFVDRGPHGAELMAYLLAAKVQRPNGVLLVRGNHETRDIQKMFTFYSECVTKYGEQEGNKIWTAINQVFDALPLAAVVDDKVFCCHGGIPPPWVCPLITAIDKVPVPLARPSEQSSIAWELLWNDPVKPNKMTATLSLELAANEGFAANAKRGTGHVFDQMALDRFLLANQLSHVVRAHELHQNGFMCQLRGRLVSVFSSSRYCGGTNDSGVALLEGGKVRLLRVNADYNSMDVASAKH